MTTRWTDVLSARGDSSTARRALRLLCDRYYAPVYAFVYQYTRQDQDARDLTHSFFLKLLESNGFHHVSGNRGRFRTYLLAAVKHYIADERAKSMAEKRGGKAIMEVADSDLIDKTCLVFPPDAYFDRLWALAILDQALSQLEVEIVGGSSLQDSASKSLWHSLKPWLVGDPPEQSQEQVAVQHAISCEHLRVMLHRWRKRFREIVKAMIADTVESSESVGAELDYLIQSLSYKNKADGSSLPE